MNKADMREGTRVRVKDGKNTYYGRVNEIKGTVVNVKVYRGGGRDFTADMPVGNITEIIRL